MPTIDVYEDEAGYKKLLNSDPIETRYTVFGVDGGSFNSSVQWPVAPGYDKLKVLLTPLLNGADLEHVTVLYNDKRADMFVDDVGMLKDLPVNEAATKIYQAAYLRSHPKTNPNTLPKIYGPAILFDRIVWY